MITPRIPQTLASVADHYDELDPFYREIWGDHVHHGLWTTGREGPADAVVALIARVAEELALHPGEDVCDIGCGYGATGEWLTNSFGVHVTGLTVSTAQLERACQRSERDERMRFLQQDWLENRFETKSFDALIAIESSEHMTDKQRFFDEAYRTLRDGGRLAVCAWLAKDDAKPWEVRFLLEPICREGRLPSMGTEADYRLWAAQAGFGVRSFFDLSRQVRRTWAICAARVARMILLDRRYRRYLRDAHARHRIFALSLPRIWMAYATGSMRYGLLVAAKPHASR